MKASQMQEQQESDNASPGACIDVEFFSGVLEGSFDGIAVFDKDSSVKYINKSALRILGHDCGDLSSMDAWLEVLVTDKEVREELRILWSGDLSHKDPPDRTIEISSSDGMKKLCRFHMARLKSGDVVLNIQDITSQRLEMDAIRRGELIYRTAVESMPFSFYAMDPNGRYSVANEYCRTRYGDIEGKRCEDIAPDEGTLQRWEENNDRVLSGETVDEEISYMEEGELRSFRNINAPIHDGDEIIGIMGINIDLSRGKKAEAMLKDSERNYRELVEQLNDVVYAVDLEGKIEYLNSAAEKVLGYTPAEMTGKAFADFVAEDDVARINLNFRKLLKGSECVVNEYRMRAADGSDRWIKTTSRTRYKGKEISGIFGIGTDITERKLAELTTTRMATAVNSAAEAIVITDAAGVIIHVNPYFEEMTGFSLEEVKNKTPALISSGVHEKSFYENMWKTIKGGDTWRGRFVNRRKDGSLFEEEAVISPVKDEAGVIVNYVAVKRSLTEQRMLEMQVRESQKMAAIGKLAHRLSHDFTNILHMINSSAELVKMKIGAEGDIGEILDGIIKAVEGGATLTSEMLAFAQPSPPNLKKRDVYLTVLGLKELFLRALPSGVSFKLKEPVERCKALLDETQLEHAMLNIIMNAGEAMPKGGSLKITVGKVKSTPDEPLFAPGDAVSGKQVHREFVEVAVSDTGSGMTEGEKDQIFEPFFTTKESRSNSGLGMSVVYAIITRHNGLVTVDSEPGKGTTCRIYIPAAE